MKERRPHTKRHIGVLLVCIVSVIALWLGILPQASGSGVVIQQNTNDIQISFHYEKSEFTIEARASEGGVITPEGRVLVPAGEGKKFSFTANVGYQIDEVVLDDETIWKRGANEDPSKIPVAYEFTRVVKDYTLEIVFTKIATDPTTSPSTDPSTSPSTDPSTSPSASASASASASPSASGATATPGFEFPTPTASTGGGGGGGGGIGYRTATASPTVSASPYFSESPAPIPAAGGGTGGGGTGGDTSGGSDTGAPETYQLSDEDIPQAGIGANTLGDCFE